MGITTTIPTNLNFPNRGVLERDAYVNAQETAQDLLAGPYTTALNQYATELNSTQADINLKAEQVYNQAVTGGYSQAYIDATFTPKILNTQTDKATPVDADLIPLSDSASSFGLKKLSWANLKTVLFGSPEFTGNPTAPTQTAGNNSTRLATTAYVDGKMVLSTAVNSTSGTSIDFTGIPSWVKRITVMFSGVSTSGISTIMIQLGSTTMQTTGYSSGGSFVSSGVGGINTTSGLVVGHNASASHIRQGVSNIQNISGNSWVSTSVIGISQTAETGLSGGSVSLSGVLDRIRITTVNGTDTFDAGSINIMYEG